MLKESKESSQCIVEILSGWQKCCQWIEKG